MNNETPSLVIRSALGRLLAIMMFTAATQQVHAGCIESDEWIQPVLHADSPQVTDRAHAMLRELVRQSLTHSQAVGAATLLAEAAAIDVEGARSGRLPRAALTGGLGYSNQTLQGVRQPAGRLARGAVSVSAPLYDAGRIAQTVSWREQLAKAARHAQLDTREQLGLQTVSLALDRSRYFKHEQVSRQHARRLACLVDSLEQVVQADPGRRSELDQARKTLQEAQLSLERSLSTKHQIERRLRRMTGADLPQLEGLTTVLGETPDLEAILALTNQSSAVGQLIAQADAADAQARALAAQGRPQVDLALDGSRTSGVIDSNGWQIGLNITIPIFDAGIRYATDAAARRAQAARMQVADTSESRLSRVAEIHAQAGSLARESTDLAAILENSARLRQATLMQWRKLGRRSLFDVMSAERDHFGLRVAQVDALHDRQQANALLWSLGPGVDAWLRDTHPTDRTDR